MGSPAAAEGGGEAMEENVQVNSESAGNTF